MKEEFFIRFIENELYLQNPPLKTNDFIKFCKERGVNTNESELEFFEKEGLLYPIIRIDRPIREDERIKFKKEGKTFWRPAHQGLQEGEKELKRYKGKRYEYYGFGSYDNRLNLYLLEKGNLFDPSKKPFQKWSCHVGERLENGDDKILSYYSSFQIHWLVILKNSYSMNINLASDKIIVSSPINRLNGFKSSYGFQINDFNEFKVKLKEISLSKLGKSYFDLDNKKQHLMKMGWYFEKILEFMLLIQSVYMPYGRSSSKHIRVKDENWHEKRRKFDPKSELDNCELTIKEIGILYGIFSKKAMEIFGVKRDDWIQLWKYFAWEEKDRLDGHIRLGVEYLQWSLMLKRFIEDYCRREILDIDEISNITNDDILKFNPSDMGQQGMLLRNIRNRSYSDPENDKEYYHDVYKRLFYIANDFDLNYQPKIMVFVEGKSEEKVFPKIFEWYYGKPENIGVEFVNFEGVDKLLSTSKNAEELKALINEMQAELKNIRNEDHMKRLNKLIKDLKDTNIVISNWTSFISYNLEKWQIIPFFISDNEGNVKHFLDAEKPIKFEGRSYNVPDDWKFLWGVKNKGKPFKGKDLEFANFTDEEIVSAINEVINENIDINIVKETRMNGDGINIIHDKIFKPGKKVKIVDTLFNNLFKKFEENEDEYILERPIFKVIEKIYELAILNHLPVDTEIELMNKKTILNWLIKENYVNYSYLGVYLINPNINSH